MHLQRVSKSALGVIAAGLLGTCGLGATQIDQWAVTDLSLNNQEHTVDWTAPSAGRLIFVMTNPDASRDGHFDIGVVDGECYRVWLHVDTCCHSAFQGLYWGWACEGETGLDENVVELAIPEGPIELLVRYKATAGQDNTGTDYLTVYFEDDPIDTSEAEYLTTFSVGPEEAASFETSVDGPGEVLVDIVDPGAEIDHGGGVFFYLDGIALSATSMRGGWKDGHPFIEPHALSIPLPEARTYQFKISHEDSLFGDNVGSRVAVVYERTGDLPKLLVTKDGSGCGVVSSNPAGINCGSSCEHAYEYGTSVELTAQASSDSMFNCWSGDCADPTARHLQCRTKVFMSEDSSCTAAFVACDRDQCLARHTPTPAEKRALILAPYHDDGYVEYCDELALRLRADPSWSVDYIGEDGSEREEVRIDELVELLESNRYWLVHVTTHGTGWDLPLEVYSSQDQRDNRFSDLAATYNSGLTPAALAKGTTEGYYYIAITREFVLEYWEGLENHPLVYCEACTYGMDEAYDLREAFLCRGAGAVVGFDGDVVIKNHALYRTAKEVSKDFYDALLDGRTVEQSAIGLWGDEGPCDWPFPCGQVYLRSFGNDENLNIEHPADINGDGTVDLLDSRMCLQIARGILSGTPAQKAAADIDGDGDVDMDDVRILAEYVIGIRDELP